MDPAALERKNKKSSTLQLVMPVYDRMIVILVEITYLYETPFSVWTSEELIGFRESSISAVFFVR
jgi:hypothetical protein